MEPYNTDKFYLGKLCLLGHEYGSTGMSLRNVKGRGCSQCVTLRLANYKEYNRLYNIGWLKQNPEEISRRKEYNRLYHLKHNQALCKADKIRFGNGRAILEDSYVKRILAAASDMCGKDMPPELIQMKREQLQLTRAIRRVKNEFHRSRNHSIG
jgi:hypothetical protein